MEQEKSNYENSSLEIGELKKICSLSNNDARRECSSTVPSISEGRVVTETHARLSRDEPIVLLFRMK